MKFYILLLRGINVGGRNVLPMVALKALLENEGCENIQTYIRSGNVVFNAKSLTLKNIAKKIESDFGFNPELVILERSEFEKIVEANPFPLFEGKTVHFYFCLQTPNVDLNEIELLIANNEEYYLQDKIFYLHAPNGVGRSKLVSNLESCLRVSATGRNLNTIHKLQVMLEKL